jgi:acetyltransferase
VREKHLVANESEAVRTADSLGYPVLLQLAGGSGGPENPEDVVQLKAADAAAVRRTMHTLNLFQRQHCGSDAPSPVTIQCFVSSGAIEVAVSSTTAHELGPVIRLGEGGCLAGAPRHAVTALAPLTPLTARELIEQSCVPGAVRAGSDPQSPDLDSLVHFLLRLSRLAVEQPRIKEVIVDPLLVWEGGVMAGEVRVTLHDRQLAEKSCRGPLARRLPKPNCSLGPDRGR